MRIKTDAVKGSASVELAGRFDANEVDGFRAAVAGLVTGAGTLTIDLEQVVFIDSTALAELIRLNKAATQAGGTLVLSRPSPPVRVILEITHLDMVFTIAPGAGDDG
ncbi:STAS domain-containing protein [Microbacterium xanthum]|uniref:STAS domain-containing protein n=1 Tax=Microbacterium xanthum TaxID=3079794 RepID=UPI002AD1EA1F|nr:MULTISPECIES: STAS domain-containing protein [unclassified Microbacterium]MDZ8171552.1 STAS domain-containing protein [Microbacterium sp. KSW-48]MDZ8200409.1 STAS domain-containing protein [Microbacterium sp. SSW1-59]